MGYFKLNFNPVTFKAQTTYGTNLTDVLMLGGYAVKDMNPVTNEASYTGIKVMGSWAELSYKKNDWEYAFLAGYSKNYGAEDDIASTDLVYARSKDIGELYRLAPRVCKKYKNLKFEFEAEYTAAAYGKLAEKAKVEDTKWIGGTRYSLGVYYFF
ncbi:hypothetical protein [Marinifilum fragile]|nr:hypothetical protein [Marinifilum fragile]